MVRVGGVLMVGCLYLAAVDVHSTSPQLVVVVDA